MVIKMKNKGKIENLFYNDKIVLITSFFIALLIWLLVIINYSPEDTRTITGVKVKIDTTVPAQFGLQVFGETNYTVDVTVKGKKYVISPASLSADDILVTAQTANVDSAGKRTLQLKAESASGATNYTISLTTQKTVDVYFDTESTVQMAVVPDVIHDGFSIVKEGFTTGEITLSEGSVTITGPSTEVNKVKKVIAQLSLSDSLTSNKSSDAELIPLDENGKSDFKYLTLDKNKVSLTIPVLRLKTVDTSVTFKNAPDDLVLTPLKFTVSPAKESFKILVDEYDKTTSYSVGTIDFKTISPVNHVFTFLAENTDLSEQSKTESFVVDVDVSALSLEYFTLASNKIKINNTTSAKYIVSGLDKSISVVGTAENLKNITVDDISAELDLSDLEIRPGQTVSVPVDVSVKSKNCWIYGTYTVDVTL